MVLTFYPCHHVVSIPGGDWLVHTGGSLHALFPSSRLLSFWCTYPLVQPVGWMECAFHAAAHVGVSTTPTFKILLRNFGYVIDGNYRWKITQSWDRVCLPVVGGHDLPFMTSLPPSWQDAAVELERGIETQRHDHNRASADLPLAVRHPPGSPAVAEIPAEQRQQQQASSDDSCHAQATAAAVGGGER